MSYELLVLDLDGTLTNSQKEITPATREALIRIQEAGKKVVLATGRCDGGVMPQVKELELDRFGSYILTYNGGRLRDCRTGAFICNHPLPPEVIRPIYDLALQYPDVDLACDTDEAVYSGIQANAYTAHEAKVSNLPLVHLEDFPNRLPLPVNALLMTGNPGHIAEIEPQLQKKFEGVISVYRSDPFYLEFMPLGIDKGTSLQVLLDYMHITADQMIACGDSYNDVPMLQVAGLGVAMANAVPEVKEAADFITRSNDEEGILHVIETFLS